MKTQSMRNCSPSPENVKRIQKDCRRSKLYQILHVPMACVAFETGSITRVFTAITEQILALC